MEVMFKAQPCLGLLEESPDCETLYLWPHVSLYVFYLAYAFEKLQQDGWKFDRFGDYTSSWFPWAVALLKTDNQIGFIYNMIFL